MGHQSNITWGCMKCGYLFNDQQAELLDHLCSTCKTTYLQPYGKGLKPINRERLLAERKKTAHEINLPEQTK